MLAFSENRAMVCEQKQGMPCREVFACCVGLIGRPCVPVGSVTGHFPVDNFCKYEGDKYKVKCGPFRELERLSV